MNNENMSYEVIAEMVERAASSLVSYDDFRTKDVAEARRIAAKCFAEFFGVYPEERGK